MRKHRTEMPTNQKRRKQRFLVGMVSVSLLTAFTLNITFADIDLKAKIQVWANKQSEIAITSIHTAIQSETETQKIRLQEQLQAGLAQQAQEFKAFTEEQKQRYINELQKHTEHLIKQQSGKGLTDADRELIINRLNGILEQAKQAMNEQGNAPIPTPLLDKKAVTPDAAEPNVSVPLEETPTVTDVVYMPNSLEQQG